MDVCESKSILADRCTHLPVHVKSHPQFSLSSRHPLWLSSKLSKSRGSFEPGPSYHVRSAWPRSMVAFPRHGPVCFLKPFTYVLPSTSTAVHLHKQYTPSAAPEATSAGRNILHEVYSVGRAVLVFSGTFIVQQACTTQRSRGIVDLAIFPASQLCHEPFFRIEGCRQCATVAIRS